MIFADVAQPDQSRIVAMNAEMFLKKGGHVVVSIKAACVDSSATPESVYCSEVNSTFRFFAIPINLCLHLDRHLEEAEHQAVGPARPGRLLQRARHRDGTVPPGLDRCRVVYTNILNRYRASFLLICVFGASCRGLVMDAWVTAHGLDNNFDKYI